MGLLVSLFLSSPFTSICLAVPLSLSFHYSLSLFMSFPLSPSLSLLLFLDFLCSCCSDLWIHNHCHVFVHCRLIPHLCLCSWLDHFGSSQPCFQFRLCT